MDDKQTAFWTDSEGRRWSTAITVGTLKRVRDLVDVNLLDVFDGVLLGRLADDPVLLANTLYAVCKPQADERNVDDEAFGELLVGDAIEDAAQALVHGIASFFPQGRRAALTSLWTKLKRGSDGDAHHGDRQAGLAADGRRRSKRRSRRWRRRSIAGSNRR